MQSPTPNSTHHHLSITPQPPKDQAPKDQAPTGKASAAQDRRRYIRHRVESPCKLIELKSGRSLPGITRDVSLGGLLVSLRTSIPFQAGERIKIGVAWRGQAVLDASTLTDAEVVRASPLFDGQQTLAIRRINTAALAQAA